MKAVVCIKRVPDTATNVKVGPDGKSIDPTGIEWVVNPYDEFAVEEALKIKEKAGAGEVEILSLGPAEAATQIRSCLAMGADRGVLLKDDRKNTDCYSTAVALAAALKDMKFDILLFGKQAVDDDGAQVPGLVCQKLGLPLVSVVVKLEINDGNAKAHREIEGGHEVIETKLPAAFTCQKGLNEPRYASLKGIMAAKKKPLEEKPATVAEPALQVLKMEYPPVRPAGRVVGKGGEAAPVVVQLLHTEAKVI
jgi:electron transfer flavoprotein beta subunit